jgi:hypothetical protein
LHIDCPSIALLQQEWLEQQQAALFHDVQMERQEQAAKFEAFLRDEEQRTAQQLQEEQRREARHELLMQQEAQQRQEERQEEQRLQEQRFREEQHRQRLEDEAADQRRDEAELWRKQQLQVVAWNREDDAKRQRLLDFCTSAAASSSMEQTGIGTPSHHTKENRQGHVFMRCKDLDYILYII